MVAGAGLYVGVGAVWGTTNALMKRGAAIAREKEAERRPGAPESFTGEWLGLLRAWQYSAPFAANLAASAFFVRALGDGPLNVAVPVTNSATFMATALAGAALGEPIDVALAMAGVAATVAGIALCISPSSVL